MEDRLLIWRCKRGGAEAMTRIYQKYRKDLLVLALALLNDKAAAEDIVHDVFVGFAEGLPGFRLTGRLRAYLMTCVANRARILLGRRQPERRPRGPLLSSEGDTPQADHSSPPGGEAQKSRETGGLAGAVTPLDMRGSRGLYSTRDE